MTRLKFSYSRASLAYKKPRAQYCTMTVLVQHPAQLLSSALDHLGLISLSAPIVREAILGSPQHAHRCLRNHLQQPLVHLPLLLALHLRVGESWVER